ncbi:MAG TPA: NfeD family protein [Chitinophagales bacterium]|nr:NfeD family protein [Chitinophagales bacterium]
MNKALRKDIQQLLTGLFILLALANTSPFIHAAPLDPAKKGTQGDTTMEKKVFVFELNQDIFPAAWRLVKNAMNEADMMHADYVVIKENTYGGDLASADSIHSRLLHAKQPVLVWITANAASAGALIAISCDSIYMRSSAVIGSASVVNETGEVMPDKYQSYMRAMMRSTAEHNGRDPLIAEGMVTPNGYLKDVADTGRIIALTANEAVKHGYCNGIAETLDDVLKQAQIGPSKITEYQTDLLDDIIAFLLNPFVNGILLLLILGGIYFEFQHPGAAFPILTSIVAAILYFSPLYLDGLADHWEIILFIVGVLLVAGEIFLLPGHGVMLITGVICIITGLTLALVRNSNFDFSFTSGKDVVIALLRVVIPLALSFFLFIAYGQNLFRTRLLKGFVLTHTQENTVGYIDNPDYLRSLIGKTGMAITNLRPAGQIEVESERYDAMADSGLISRGESVKVIEVSGNILVVRRS